MIKQRTIDDIKLSGLILGGMGILAFLPTGLGYLLFAVGCVVGSFAFAMEFMIRE